MTEDEDNMETEAYNYYENERIVDVVSDCCKAPILYKCNCSFCNNPCGQISEDEL